MWGWLLCLVTVAVVSDVSGAGAGAARLVCYVENARATEGFTECTHLVYTGDARGDKLDALLKEYRKNNPRLKIVLRIAEIDKDLRKLLKSKHVQGLEIYDAHRSLNKTKVLQAVEEARSTLSSSGGGPLFLALPANPELLAKYYDLRVLVKKVDLVMVQTHALGVVKKMTYHPSRLSGMWDMMNTDSVVDLIVGLGVPASKIVISLPATAHKFTLLNETLSTPGSPTVEEEPKEIDQTEVCRLLQKGRWTLERDQDLSAPYAFKNTTWMSFEDSSSVDVKGKYARVRGLAGLALYDADRDLETPCGVSLKAALAKVLNQQSRAPRAAVLRSLEHEILSAPGRALDALQVSPYRINQVVDSDGVIHSIREDTRTEFSCSRQGYFVHPRSCARFYRCVKFDQLSPDYTVFEFDCPAGLAFDARYEVCVWPGSLPSATACPGSAEIAPVPRDRFLCPDREGYYADPENCRWFFACLDHGKAPLTAYEFRCPFGLGFDAEKLKCDWPWLVPACGNIGRYEAEAYGFSSATLTGATGFHGKTADAVNIAAHQSLVSGASLDNLVGIQSGFLTKDDTLDSNFIASQELASGAFGSGQSYEIGNDASISQGQGLAYQVGDANLGLVQPTKYINAPKYTSGSIILDDYRLPSTKTSHGKAYNIAQANIQNGGYTKGLNSYSGSIISSGNYQSSNYNYDDDNSGAYIHDPSGDYAEPYKHVDSPVVPYTHDDAGYRHNGEYNDYGSSTGQGNNGGKYVDNNDGQYVHDNSGSYIHTESTGGSYSSSYNADYSDSFNSNSGKYEGGVYRADGHIGAYNSDTTGQYHGTYSNSNTGNYLSNSKAYTGASHTLTAGAVNVGLVGKTTLVDAGYTDQLNYQQANAASKLVTGHEVIHETYPGHIPYVSQPAVSINHVGTNSQNLNEYSYVTTPTSSGIPTTATPFAVTASVPVTTYRTTYVPEAPKSTVKQLFGISQPAITYVQPTAIAVKQYVTPKVEITDYNQGLNYQYENNAFSSNQYDGSSSVSQSSSGKSVTSGYEYSKPSIKFEDGISFTTPAPIVSVSTYKPQGFGHGQQTVHKIESVGFEYSSPTPITEQPFKKLVAYTTGPSVTYSQASDANLPHSYSHQTIHKVESNAYAPAVESGYDFSKSDIRYESPKPVIQLTTVQPVVSSYQQPQVYSHQTLHKVDASQVKTYSEKESELGYEYKKPAIKFEDAVKTYGYSTPAPIVVSTINPQSLEHQIIQKVETPQVQYLPVPSTTPQPAVVSTYQPQVFSHQTIHKVDASQVNVYSKNDGYEYQKPEVKFEEGIKTAYEYSTPAPIVSTYKPQSYNHQTIHKIDTPKVEITYQQTPVTVYENPLLKYTEKVIPETNVHHAYNTQAYSHQTIHKIEDSKLYTPSIKVAYESNVNYEEPTVKYTTAQPELAIQQVVSTYQPQVQSHQTLHNVEASKVNTYSGSTGYNYEAPSVKFEDGPNIIHEYSTSAPTVISTYKPQSYSHQTIHKVEAQKYIPVSSTPKVAVTYQQPSVSVYENPILTYTEKVTPITYVKPTASVYTQTYQPIIHQHEVSHVSQPVKYESSAQQSYTSQNIQLNQEGYSYSQPEIQRNVETLNKGQSYSDANLVSHQFIQQSNDQYESGKDIVIVSSTPSTLAYEEHYSEYETPRKQQLYKAPEYIPPKTEYQQSYSVSSTLSPLAEQQSSIIHETDDEKYYKAVDNSPRYKSIHNSPLQQISYSTSHISQPKKESIHFSSFPGTTITTKYKQVAYESPEIQVGYKAEEYLPPVVSTPIVTSTYKPSTLSSASTTREYLPPSDIKYNEREYLPPKVENSYLPPKTAKPIVISTTQRPTYKYTQSTTEYSAPEYLPPADEKGSDIVNFENFDFNQQNTEEIIKNNPYQEQYSVSTLTPLRKPNLVVERAKSNLLGFGTVGPDAGLISPVTYTTAAPVVVSSTNTPYTYIESTTQYKAPEYLPPSDTRPEKIRPVPVHRQQNIVVETAKSHLLGFGTVGPDAGLVSPVTYTTAQPIISSTDSYSLRPKTVTSTLAPFNQEISEVPIRKTKPKVAVVTKINDFNPLLVRKLGAVCSCQSPVLILKGKRPNVQVQPDVIDYNNDYDDSDRGDISDNQWGQRSGNLQLSINSATPSPIISSTINPIIVPDDSYYQDYQEPNNYVAAVTPKINELYSENFESSTPIVVSSTEKTVRIRPRVKAVTIAPTYKTVLLNQEAASNTEVKEAESADSIINSQSFDRYGPGGWRSRDETLQGTVDCQRAGLFRHPKQCNKFYACRWDCTKQRFTLHVFNCPVQLTFDPNMGACNWPSQGPACQGDTLLTNTL